MRPVLTISKKIFASFFPGNKKERKRKCPEDDGKCNDYCKEKEEKCYHDCLKLPKAINDGQEGEGCSGAVNRNGVLDQKYCNGKSYAGEEGDPVVFPWWPACCYWDDSNNMCTPKRGKFNELDSY